MYLYADKIMQINVQIKVVILQTSSPDSLLQEVAAFFTLDAC